MSDPIIIPVEPYFGRQSIIIDRENIRAIAHAIAADPKLARGIVEAGGSQAATTAPALLARALMESRDADNRISEMQIFLAECASVMADAVHTLENFDESDWRRGSIALLNETIDKCNGFMSSSKPAKAPTPADAGDEAAALEAQEIQVAKPEAGKGDG